MRQLTNDPAKDRGVTWSPDGKTLYFYSNRDGPNQIWSIHTDGSGLVRVTDPAELKRIAAGTHIYMAGISPDGRTLAAQTDLRNVFVHLDRPFSQRLERFDTHFASPKWSPDGKQIVGALDDGGIGIYSPLSRRSEKLIEQGSAPQWLSDSRHIVFFEKQSIVILDLETRRKIVAAQQLELAGASPRLSRDGSTLYARQTLELGDIWLVHFEQ